MFVLGFSLYGTTVLIPQLVQTLLGYTAELAGFVISPGGICIMLMMPVVGFLIGRTDPRWLICFGFFILSTSMVLMHTFSLDRASSTSCGCASSRLRGWRSCSSRSTRSATPA